MSTQQMQVTSESEMPSSDWSKVETLTHTSINENDLFGGDLFGDELMDIYTSGSMLAGLERELDEIPTLALPNETSTTAEPKSMETEATVTEESNSLSQPVVQYQQHPKKDIIHFSHTPTFSAADSTVKIEAVDTINLGPSPITMKLLQKGIHTAGNGSTNPLMAYVGGKQSMPVSPSPEQAETQAAPPTIVPSNSPHTITIPSQETQNTAPQEIPKVDTPVSNQNFPSASEEKVDEDFAAVAQAAVSNLILTAGSQLNNTQSGINHNILQEADSEPANVKVPHTSTSVSTDISTERVKALTSPNWVAACNSISSSADENYQPVVKRRRQNLTADERAKQNRVRNREHARNTRLRKKAYVEELKRALLELVSQRDAAFMEKKLGNQRDLEQREVRFRVMEEFLKLRGSNEPNVSRWVAILEDGFTLVLPTTPYRAMVKNTNMTTVSNPLQRQSGRSQTGLVQTLNGAMEVMADASSVANLLEKISGNKMYMAFDCNREKFIMDGCSAVLDWSAVSTVSAGNQASPIKLYFKGSMCAKFSPASNKLMSAELLFDTGAVIAQLKQAFAQSRQMTTDNNQPPQMKCSVSQTTMAHNSQPTMVHSSQPAIVHSAQQPIPSPALASISVCSISERYDSSSDECEQL